MRNFERRANRIAPNNSKQGEQRVKEMGGEAAREENPIARITDKYECLGRSGGSHRPSRISQLSSPCCLDSAMYYLQGQVFGE